MNHVATDGNAVYFRKAPRFFIVIQHPRGHLLRQYSHTIMTLHGMIVCFVSNCFKPKFYSLIAKFISESDEFSHLVIYCQTFGDIEKRRQLPRITMSGNTFSQHAFWFDNTSVVFTETVRRIFFMKDEEENWKCYKIPRKRIEDMYWSFIQCDATLTHYQIPTQWYDHVLAFSMLSNFSSLSEDGNRGISDITRKLLLSFDFESIIHLIFSHIDGSIPWLKAEEIEMPLMTLHANKEVPFEDQKYADKREIADYWYHFANKEDVNFKMFGTVNMFDDESFSSFTEAVQCFEKKYVPCHHCNWLVPSTELVKCRAEEVEKESRKNRWKTCKQFACFKCMVKVEDMWISKGCSAVCLHCGWRGSVATMVLDCNNIWWCAGCRSDKDNIANHSKMAKNTESCLICYKKDKLFLNKQLDEEGPL